MGWAIVKHSFILLLNNLTDALKVSLLPILLAVAVTLIGIVVAPPVAPETVMAVPTPELAAQAASGALMTIVTLIVYLVVFAWIAVGWHRFVLLEEYPGWVPGLSGRPVWPYLRRTILLVLILLLVAMPVVLLVSLALGPMMGGPEQMAAGTPNNPLALVVTLLLGILLGYVWMRIAVSLPGVALARPMSLREGWDATAPLSGAILQAAAILVALNIAGSLVTGLLSGIAPLAFVIQLALTWLTLMIGTSILTTLYGHAVEGRALPS